MVARRAGMDMKFLKLLVLAVISIISVYAISNVFAYLLTNKLFVYIFGGTLGVILFTWVCIAAYCELKKTGMLAEIQKNPKAGFKKLMKCNYSIYY